MRLVFNIILVLLVALLIWALTSSIREPIAFKAAKEKRETAVIDKLMEVRTAQELFRSMKGEFAPDFDTLSYVLKNDSFVLVSIIGDPDDPNFTGEIRYDTMFVPAIDSIRSLAMNVDSLRYVPYSDGAQFSIDADTMTYQSTNVPVVQVGIPYEFFMGKYKSPRFARYDNGYDPKKVLRFGDMNKPSTAGNWE